MHRPRVKKVATRRKPHGLADLKLRHLVFAKGNNMRPVRRALARRPQFRADEFERELLAAAKRRTSPRIGYSPDVWTANFVWKPTYANMRLSPPEFHPTAGDLRRRQVVNHLLAVEPLCSKNSLYNTLAAYCAATPGVVLDRLVPPTVLVHPRSGVAPEDWAGWAAFADLHTSFAMSPQSKNMWLAKPTNQNRGIGIEVLSSLEDTRAFLVSKAAKASMGVHPCWILQKYMEKPLLINSRKFDVRVWVLVVDDGSVYMYMPGYVRTSSEKFSLDVVDKYVHLTNFCQQKLSPSFGEFEAGNTLTFATWEEHLTKARPDHPDSKHLVHRVVLPQMRDLVAVTLKSLQLRGGAANGFGECGFGKTPLITRQKRFELLGYDFMVKDDDKLTTQLIEINTNPSLTYQTDWHETMVDTMVEQMLQLVVDPVWPTLVVNDGAKVPPPLAPEANPDDPWASPGWQLILNVFKDRPKGLRLRAPIPAPTTSPPPKAAPAPSPRGKRSPAPSPRGKRPPVPALRTGKRSPAPSPRTGKRSPAPSPPPGTPRTKPSLRKSSAVVSPRVPKSPKKPTSKTGATPPAGTIVASHRRKSLGAARPGTAAPAKTRSTRPHPSRPGSSLATITVVSTSDTFASPYSRPMTAATLQRHQRPFSRGSTRQVIMTPGRTLVPLVAPKGLPSKPSLNGGSNRPPVSPVDTGAIHSPPLSSPPRRPKPAALPADPQLTGPLNGLKGTALAQKRHRRGAALKPTGVVRPPLPVPTLEA